MAGKVYGQDVIAMVGEIAALQNPDAVVIEHAMDKYDAGFVRIVGFTSGIDKHRRVVDSDVHGAGPCKRGDGAVCGAR